MLIIFGITLLNGLAISQLHWRSWWCLNIFFWVTWGLPDIARRKKLISLFHTATVAYDFVLAQKSGYKLPSQAVHICKEVQLLVIRDSPKEIYS